MPKALLTCMRLISQIYISVIRFTLPLSCSGNDFIVAVRVVMQTARLITALQACSYTCFDLRLACATYAVRGVWCVSVTVCMCLVNMLEKLNINDDPVLQFQ